MVYSNPDANRSLAAISQQCVTMWLAGGASAGITPPTPAGIQRGIGSRPVHDLHATDPTLLVRHTRLTFRFSRDFPATDVHAKS